MADCSLLGRSLRAPLLLLWLAVAAACSGAGRYLVLPAGGHEGVIRSWSDCAEIVGGVQDIGVAGLVRAEDGVPIGKAQMLFVDGSRGERRLGAWWPVGSDSIENLVIADSQGRFLIPMERVAKIPGVATLSAFKHGFRGAAASWTLPAPVCLELVLTRDQ